MSSSVQKNLTVSTQPKIAGPYWLWRFRKLGLVCFLFFLIKGLLWLLVPVALYMLGSQ